MNFRDLSRLRVHVNTGILKSIIPATRFEVWKPDSDRENDHQKRITLGLSFEFDRRSYSRLRVNYEVNTKEVVAGYWTLMYQRKLLPLICVINWMVMERGLHFRLQKDHMFPDSGQSR